MAYGSNLQGGVLGSVAPAAASLVAAYTVPAGTQAACRAVIGNRGGATTVRLALAPGGAADAVEQYLLYDFALPANESFSTDEIPLRAGDVIRASSASGNVTFNILGSQSRAA